MGRNGRDRQIKTSEHQKCEPKENKLFLTGGMISYTFPPHHFVYPFASIDFQICFKVKHGDSSLYIGPKGTLMLFNVLSLAEIIQRLFQYLHLEVSR